VEEFDELEDDFVLQAAGGDDGDDGDDGGDGDGGGGFDFDAHIARLIAASEQEVGIRARRRWVTLHSLRVTLQSRRDSPSHEIQTKASLGNSRLV
jgi:hypothetical protein